MPGHESVEGCCPVKCCRLRLDSIPKHAHNRHIRSCLHREFTSKHEHLQSDVHYCHQYYEWVLAQVNGQGTARHTFKTQFLQTYGTVTYCHTLVRPGYCQFCLGDGALPVTKRLESWTRDHQLWNHVNDHIQTCSWAITYPHPNCDEQSDIAISRHPSCIIS